MALTDKLKAIADAIRSKTGSTESMTLDQMATEISNISTGGSIEEPYILETYDANGNLIDAKLVGYTKVRDYAFYGCKNITLFSIPSVITSIGSYAFSSCSNLALISLPSGITSIGERGFAYCSNLALTSLPSGVTSIGDSAFSYCSKLALTSLPSGITSIEGNAFTNCKGLTSITFKGTPTSINSTAFNGCTNLTTINVPWAEGDVSGAPWGATNATINYNYTGE